jgi:hypothetical protein
MRRTACNRSALEHRVAIIIGFGRESRTPRAGAVAREMERPCLPDALASLQVEVDERRERCTERQRGLVACNS